MTSIESIKKVIIYLRKSRGDEHDALTKHLERLVAHAERMGWEYTIMREDIISGERLNERPVMNEVLDLIESGAYDGVLVVDYDRLSRGNSKDFGTIIEVFQYSEKYIITPERIYDTNDRNDIMMLGVQGVFAHNELKQIVDRMMKGKRDGARQGKLTNGRTPYPYYYEKKIVLNDKGKEVVTNTIKVNPEHLNIYNYMKDAYINKQMGVALIAYELNRQGIPSPTNKFWQASVVKKILINEFHLGKIIYGKTKWKKDRTNQRKITQVYNRDEWIIAEGTHEKLKTIEEHEEILRIKVKNNITPNRSKSSPFPTSGLIFCKRCGKPMKYTYGRVEKKTGKLYHIISCATYNEVGVKCPQRGIKLDEDFYNLLRDAVSEEYYRTKEIATSDALENESIENKMILENKLKELKDVEDAIERIYDAYESKEYSLEVFNKRRSSKELQLETLRQEIRQLDIPKIHKLDDNKLEILIDEFKNNWNVVNDQRKKFLLSQVVKKIYYDRQENTLQLEVEYL